MAKLILWSLNLGVAALCLVFASGPAINDQARQLAALQSERLENAKTQALPMGEFERSSIEGMTKALKF